MIRRAADRALAAWDELDDLGRRRTTAVGWALVLYLVHYAILSWWYIEDAAISFAYARHLAQGLGPVAVIGAEPVEGFSNPTWTFALAAFDLVGIEPFMAAKLLGAVAGAAALAPAERWARRMLADVDAGLWPALAPLLLAAWPWFVLWNASGLENSFVVLFLAFGATAVLDEVDDARPRWPRSALWFAALALTRPEAPMYGAVAALVGAAIAVRRHGLAAAARWFGLFTAIAAPIGLAYLAWRWATFAWPLPNTYYAKLAEGDRFQPFDWDKRGWPYLRGFGFESGLGFLLPVYVVGASGTRGARLVAAIVLVATGVVLVVPGLELSSALGLPDEPQALEVARIVFLYAAAASLPLLGLGRPGWPARTLAWGLALVAVFFALYSGGDWMKVHRWFSMATVPLAVLYTDAVARLAPTFLGWAARAPRAAPVLGRLGAALALVPVVTGVSRTAGFFQSAETTPYDVYRRVKYMQEAQRRLHLDHVTLMDVDMGAHLWWSGFGIVDMAGLVDAPMAHHTYQKSFVQQYVFEETKPDFAHVHGSWASKTRMTRHAAWREYLEIPPYAVSARVTHPGNHIRRDLIQTGRWLGPERSIGYDAGVEIVGWDAPATEVSGSLYVEIGWRSPAPRPPDLRTVLFLSGPGGVRSWEIPPGYDWWTPREWDRGEIVVTRATLPLPADLPPGSYDLGLVSYGVGVSSTRGVFGVVDAPEGTVQEPPVVARGEVRFPNAITIVTRQSALSLADRDLGQLREAASTAACDRADKLWQTARRRVDRDDPWQGPARAAAEVALGRCFARRGAQYADAAPDPEKAAAAGADLARARRLAPTDGEVDAAGRRLADALIAEADHTTTSSDHYQRLRLALLADPSRAAVRREAEAWRDKSLGLEATK